MRYIVPNDDKVRTIPFGRTGENDYTEVAFDISAWQGGYSNIHSIVLIIQRAGEDESYPATMTIEGQYAIHTLSSTDLAIVGTGKCQMQMLAGDDIENPIIAKSKIYSTIVLCSLGGTDEPPEPWQPWMTYFEELAAVADMAAGDASGFANRAENAAVEAEGAARQAVDDKFGDLTALATPLPSDQLPTATYDASQNEITFGIPQGEKGDPGAPGQQGVPGQAATIALGSVTTLSPGSQAYAENTGTPSAAVFNFYIPKGDKGEQGEQGEQGEKGDVNIATFELNPNTGILSMITPDDYSSPVFQLNNGYLEVVI